MGKGAASEASRGMHILKRREKALEQLEEAKAKIVNENQIKSKIHNKFTAHYDAVEAKLKANTVGLLTLDQMKEKQEFLIQEREKQIATSEEARLKKDKKKLKRKKRENKGALSFAFEDEEEEGWFSLGVFQTFSAGISFFVKS